MNPSQNYQIRVFRHQSGRPWKTVQEEFTSCTVFHSVGQWSHGLFNCFDNFGICIVSYFLPCVQFGQSAEKVGAGSCFVCGLLYLIPIVDVFAAVDVRSRIRESQGIEGTTLNDCLIIIFCPVCALAQEAMELDHVPGGMAMCRQ